MENLQLDCPWLYFSHPWGEFTFLFHHFWILILNVQATTMDNFMPHSLKSFDAFRESTPINAETSRDARSQY